MPSPHFKHIWRMPGRALRGAILGSLAVAAVCLPLPVSAQDPGDLAAEDNADLVLVISEEDADLNLPDYLFEPCVEVVLPGAQKREYDRMARTEERRVGKECGGTCSTRGAAYH